jgi:hypothetical protein
MKRTVCLAVAALCVSFVTLSAAPAQVPYTEDSAQRVVLHRILPGHNDAAMADLKKNGVPVWESGKNGSLIVSYHLFLNTGFAR